jgi:hypothetical protein
MRIAYVPYVNCARLIPIAVSRSVEDKQVGIQRPTCRIDMAVL